MFEQAMLSAGPAGKRVWTTCAGMSAEALLVGLAILAPLVFPQALPSAHAILVNFLPLVPPPPRGRPSGPQHAAAPAARPELKGFFEPSSMPAAAAIIVDSPPAASDAPTGIGVLGGMTEGGDGIPGGILPGILEAATRALPVIHPPAPAPAAAVEKPAVIPRYREGGNVHRGEPLFRPEPQYPVLARQMRVSGVVTLEGVIGTDGRIRELKVLSGHPLLVRAAVDAVRTWRYQPTTLNGDPVEVIAPITVTFTLN